jgi:hypothetical protein
MSETSKHPNAQAEQDLLHFLRLASHQLRHRIRTVASQDPQSPALRRMRLLEELLKEQMPDENTRPTTGSAR